MRRRGNQHQLGGLLMLLLFGVFAACVLILLLTGARAYRRLTQRDQAAFDRRTCVQYLATRVRQGDAAGGVSVRPFGEGNALALPAGEGYVTWVYWHDGWLMELYTLEDSGLSPEDGARIMPLAGLSLPLKDGLLTAELADGAGETDTLLLSLRGGGGAAG